MKKFICLFFLILSAKQVFGQASVSPVLADSLKKELLQAKEDTSKVLLLLQLAQCYTSIHLDTAKYYGKQGKALAKQLKYLDGELRCAVSLGFVMARTSDHYEGLKILLEAQTLCERFNKPEILAQVFATIGGTYINLREIKKAQPYVYKAKDLHDKYNLPESTNPMNLELGVMYRDLGMTDSAIIYMNKAYKVGLEQKIPSYLCSATYYLGTVYIRMGQFEKGVDYFKQSIGFAAEYKITYALTRSYQGLASVYHTMGKPDSAIFFAKKALEGSNGIAYQLSTVNSAALLLSQIYEKKNNPLEALKYHKIAIEAKDSLFNLEKTKQIEKLTFEEQEREAITQRRIKAHQLDFENKVKFYALLSAFLILGIGTFMLYRNNQQKQKANNILHQQKAEIDNQKAKTEKTLTELKATQAQLIQSEKLASLGELTAGIAHEIQNPLNFVNNFSELSVDLVKDLKEEMDKPDIDKGYIDELFTDLTSNQEKINHHGKRASSIVKGMLEHSRASTGVRELTDINKLADEYLRLSYHGLRAKDKNFNADFTTNFDVYLPKIEVIPQDIGRVLLNLINNAFYAVNERTQAPHPPEGKQYEPTVNVSTHYSDSPLGLGGQIIIKVKDNGTGMPESVRAKVFQPFFTTKPTGSGTGLGLSLAYDIVTKGHGGTLEVQSTEGVGTEFTIQLPTAL